VTAPMLNLKPILTNARTGWVAWGAVAAALALPLAPAHAETRSEVWGQTSDGRPIHRFTMTNKSGAHVSVMELGAAVTELWVPDKNGKMADVVLGFEEPLDYITNNSPQFGLVIGRFANRIVGGRFTLGEHEYQLPTQGRSGSVMHGGAEGFGTRPWTGQEKSVENGDAVTFTIVSPDGDQGFPGLMVATVTYTWTDDNQLIIDYTANTTKPTVVNLTNHSYFNLAGAGNGDILDHKLQIHADFYTAAEPNNTPTGEILKVRGTPFDFTSAKSIRQDMDSSDPLMTGNRGFNVNYVLRRSTIPGEAVEASVLTDPASGRTLRVLTSEPGLMLYTANFISTERVMKGGVKYPLRAGVALETQHFPDAPNFPHYPRTTLMPGDTFRSQTIFAFGIDGGGSGQ